MTLRAKGDEMTKQEEIERLQRFAREMQGAPYTGRLWADLMPEIVRDILADVVPDINTAERRAQCANMARASAEECARIQTAARKELEAAQERARAMHAGLEQVRQEAERLAVAAAGFVRRA